MRLRFVVRKCCECSDWVEKRYSTGLFKKKRKIHKKETEQFAHVVDLADIYESVLFAHIQPKGEKIIGWQFGIQQDQQSKSSSQRASPDGDVEYSDWQSDPTTKKEMNVFKILNMIILFNYVCLSKALHFIV